MMHRKMTGTLVSCVLLQLLTGGVLAALEVRGRVVDETGAPAPEPGSSFIDSCRATSAGARFLKGSFTPNPRSSPDFRRR